MKVTLYCLHCLFPHEFTGPSMFAVDSFVCVKCGREGAQAAVQPPARLYDNDDDPGGSLDDALRTIRRPAVNSAVKP